MAFTASAVSLACSGVLIFGVVTLTSYWQDLRDISALSLSGDYQWLVPMMIGVLFLFSAALIRLFLWIGAVMFHGKTR